MDIASHAKRQTFTMVEKLYISYNHVHKLCQEAAETIKKFNPTLMIAIGKRVHSQLQL